MIFHPQSETDLDTVAEFLELALQSATSVDRPLTLNNAIMIQVDCLNAGLLKAEARIAELEARLGEHGAKKRH